MTREHTCSVCQTSNSIDNKFCDSCGANLSEQKTTAVNLSKDTNIICSKCQTVNSGDNQFCNSCGFNLHETYVAEVPTNENQRVLKNQSKKSFFKNKLVLVIGAVAIIAIAYFVLNMFMSNKSAIIKSLEESAQTGKANGFMETLTVDNYSDAMVKSFKNLIEEEEDLSELSVTAKKVLTNMEDRNLELYNFTLPSGNGEIKVEKTKKLGLFDIYKLTPQTVDIMKEETHNDRTVEITGLEKPLKLKNEYFQGKVLPGEYTYTVTWDSVFGKVKSKHPMTITAQEVDDFDFEVPFYEETLFDRDDYPSATYFINGKEQDVSSNIDEYANEISVPEGTEFDISAEIVENGIVYKSNVAHIKEGGKEVLEFKKYKQDFFTADPSSYEDEEDSSSSLDDSASIDDTIDNYLSYYTSEELGRLSEVIDVNSAFYSSQYDYLSSQIDKGVEIDIDSYDILERTELSSNTYKVTVAEKYSIRNPGEDYKTVDQTSVYTVRYIEDDGFYITDFKIK